MKNPMPFEEQCFVQNLVVESPHQEQHQQEQCCQARLMAKPAYAGISFSDDDFVMLFSNSSLAVDVITVYNSWERLKTEKCLRYD